MTRRMFASTLLLLFGLAVLPAAGTLADATSVLDRYGGGARGTPLWIAIETNALPGLPVVDLRIPHAVVGFDSTPSSHAVATWLETGALVQTAFGLGEVSQPQYAYARFPGANGTSTASVFDETDPSGQLHGGLAIADAAASQTGAEATSAVMRLGAQGASAPASAPVTARRAAISDVARQARSALVDAVEAFRRSSGLPSSRAADSGALLAVDKLEADARVDRVPGRASAVSESRAEGIDLGGGLVSIHSVTGRAMAGTDGGSGKGETSMGIAGASIGGVPVRIGPEGVTVAGGEPSGGSDAASLTESLNAALGAAGWRIRLLGSETTDAASAVAEVRGVELAWNAPLPQGSGIPSLSWKVVIGQAEADVYGARTTVAGAHVRAAGAGPGAPSSPHEFLPVPVVPPPATAEAPTPQAPAPAPERLVRSARRPMGGVALLYVLWQLSAIATLAGVRRTRRARPA